MKSYKVSSFEGVKVDLGDDDKKKEAIGFYWIDEGKGLQVEFKIEVNGNEIKGAVEYEVKRPTYEFKSVTTTIEPKNKGFIIGEDSFKIFKPLALRFGRVGNPGIQWDGKATAPEESGGAIGIGQLVNAIHKATANNKASGNKDFKSLLTTDGKFVLDTEFPVETTKLKAKETGSVIADDSPGNDLNDNFTFKSREDQFQTFLLFKPDGTDSIWVTLAELEWNAKVSVVRTGAGMWDFSDKPAPDSSKDPKSKNSIRLPEWKKNIVDFKFAKE